MNLLLFSLWLVALDGPLTFGESVVLAPVGEDSDYFMEEPLSFDFDDAGNYYVLDGGAKTIFTWDKQGRYTGTIGKPGQGPGELVLSGRGPSGGFINAYDGKLYLMDMRKQEVMVFADKAFQKALPMRMSRGRVLNFAMLDPNTFLMQRRRAGDDKMLNELVKVNAEGEVVETLESQADDTFQMGGSGNRRSFKIKAFNPAMITAFNRKTGDMLVGHTGEPSFRVVRADGSSTTIKVPLPRAEVTQADKDEFFKQFEGRPFKPEVSFPDKKAFYTHLISLGDKGFLVYDQSSFDRKVQGVHLAADGAVKGRFTMALGQQGALLASSGRVLAISLNADDEFVMHELKID